MDTEHDYTLQKQKVRTLYEEGKIDEAIDIVMGLPKDDPEVRELNRALRYADEARGIVKLVKDDVNRYNDPSRRCVKCEGELRDKLPPRYDDGPSILKPE
jgi:hypothetical protein